MLQVLFKTSFVFILIAAIVLMPQVHVMESLAIGCTDECTNKSALEIDAGCCGSDTSSDEEKDASGEPTDREPQPCKPCDGPCDCPCCIKTVRPAPMLSLSLQPVVIPELPALVLLPPNSRPGQAALSVLVQPPIA